MTVLEQLLHPYSRETFFREYWTQRGLLITSPDPEKFRSLFSWAALNHLLNYHFFDPPHLRSARSATATAAVNLSATSELLQRFQHGETLILNEVHKLTPELVEFTTGLQAHIHQDIHINLYCSWPGQQGLDLHYDTHEVFVLQIEGSKQWHVFSETLPFPTSTEPHHNVVRPDAAPYIQEVLHPGDVLYIPRGHWHYAIAMDQPSLHLTIGIHPRTGRDFLQWVMGQLQQRDLWRQTFPLVAGQADPDALSVHIDALFADFVDFFVNSGHDIAEEYRTYLHSQYVFKPAFSLPHQLGFELFPGGIDTYYRASPFQPVSLVAAEPGCSLFIEDQQLDLEQVPLAVMEKLLQVPRFSGRELAALLPDLSWEPDLTTLLSQLVAQRVLFLDTSRPESRPDY